MAKKRFLRTNVWLYSRLGARRKNKQVYRRARGGENKLRLKRKGRLRNVSIGFRSEKKTRDLVRGLRPIVIHNIKEIKQIKKDEIGVLAKIGKKKKIEVANYILENKTQLLNFNAKKFLRNTKVKEPEIKEKGKDIKEKDKNKEVKK